MDAQQRQAALEWLNRNRRMLVEQYRDRYVAYNDRGMLAVGDRLLETCEMAERSGEEFAIYLVPKYTAFRQADKQIIFTWRGE